MYKISIANGIWHVYSGYLFENEFVYDEVVFSGTISDCYAYIQAEKEGYLS
jgi:hypothetical protein